MRWHSSKVWYVVEAWLHGHCHHAIKTWQVKDLEVERKSYQIFFFQIFLWYWAFQACSSMGGLWMGGFKIGFKNWLHQSKQSFSPIIVHPALDLFRLTQEKGIETASNKIQNFVLYPIKKLGHFVDKFYWILNQKVLKFKDWSKVAGQYY